MTRKDDKKVVATVGHVRRQDGMFRVRCAACGRGVESPIREGLTIGGARNSLRENGWDNGIDGLWRCALHSKGESK